MMTPMRFTATLGFSVACCLLGCHHERPLPRSEAAPNQIQVDCGPGITKEQILDVAAKAVASLWGINSLEPFNVAIEEEGCDYRFFALHKGTEAAEDITLLIDRTGRVKSVPQCWWLGPLGNCPTT